MSITSASRLSYVFYFESYNNVHHFHHNHHHIYHMHHSFNPITMSFTITITFITCITASILYQCPSLASYNTVSIVYHMHRMLYSLNPITISITMAITFIICHTASILKQCRSPSPSCLSHASQLRSYNNVHHFHHHRHHVYHMNCSFNPTTMSITIAIKSITCITASIL